MVGSTDWLSMEDRLAEYLDRFAIEDNTVGKDVDPSKSALGQQQSGSHYLGFKIQPYEFFIANQLPFHKADIIKRIMRYDLPTGKGLEDLKKIKHEVDLIIELEEWETK